MNRHTPEQIEDLLRSEREQQQTEPPADLLAKIRSEIPEHLVVSATVEQSKRRSAWTPRRMQLLAASLFVVVAASIVASRVLVEEPEVRAETTVVRQVPGGETLAGETPVDENTVSGADQDSLKVLGYLGDTESDRPSREPGPAAAARVDTATEAASTEARGAGRRDLPATEGANGVQPADEVLESRLEAASVADAAPSSNVKPRFASEDSQPASAGRAVDDTEAPEPSSRYRDEAGEPARRALEEKEIAALEEEARRIRQRLQKLVEKPDAEIDFASPEAEPPMAVEPPPAPPQPAPDPVVMMERARLVPRPGISASTGGSAEPNDAPYGDVFFESTGVNPFIDTEDDRLSTFGLDVDTGSYTVARRYLEDGNMPPAAAIRVEEFINYFDYGDPAPRRDDFAISMEGAPSPFAEGPRYQLLRFGIKARDIARRARRPATLIFVVDTSGSMEQGNRIGLVKRALTLLLDELDRDDRVGLVEYSTRARILLEPTRDKLEVERALRRLVPNGSTNAEDGLLLGYELADRYFRQEGINRVILCSDGVANVGRTGPNSILERIGREADRGIEITTVGFGMGNYNDVLMEQLADRGNGRYAYVDTLQEARRIFVEGLTGTLETVARDAKVQVEFNPEVVSRYRLLGYENRDIADDRFRDDSVDAGEIGAGHTVTALYEVKLHESPGRRADLATVHLRWESMESRRVREIDSTIRIDDLERSWRSASPALRLATVVAEFAEIMKQSYWAKDARFEDLLGRAERLEDDFRDHKVSELVDLMNLAARRSTDRSWEK